MIPVNGETPPRHSGALSLKSSVSRSLEITAPDIAALLVDFLSRSLTLGDINHEVYPRVAFDEFSETHLKGTLFGVKVEEFDEDIKAVTYHGVEVKNVAGGFEAVIIYDI